ncbi:MAG: SDR family oxidoreductase [Bryobacteraceae bacterium]|jgi:NAD(P)-dependent dehydrogenase (short-subunit alcohol dehydrogenase family)
MSPPAQLKVVLVTGASSGIGQAVARHLAGSGWRVFGTSRGQTAGSDGVEMLVMDADDDASVSRSVAAIVEKTGRLDAVVNNAGWALMGPIEDTSMAEARAQMETNFFGVLRVCRAVLPVMREQRSGYIVNISSLGGAFGMPFSGIYSASKFAVEGLSESLRLETRRFGVHVVLIEPGDTRSQLPARRRTAEAALHASAYREIFDRFQAKQAGDEAKAPPPDAVAALVGRILRDPRPALRYSVGMWDQRMVLPLKRLLPHRWFERILGAALGV